MRANFVSGRYVLVAVVLAAVLGGGALIVGAQDAPQDGPATQENETDRQSTTYLRVVHASPDAPAVDVYVDNESVLTDVPFGEVSDYQTLAGGTRNVTITAAGDREAVVFDGTVTLDPRSVNTLAATGQVDGEESTFLPVLYRDDALEPGADEAALSVVHLSPDAPAVDVTTEDGTVLAENVTFRNASDYATVPAGDYTVEIREATPDADGEVLLSQSVSLEGGAAYSAMGIGLASADAEQPATETPPGVTETDAPTETNETEAPPETNETEAPPEATETEALPGANETETGVGPGTETPAAGEPVAEAQQIAQPFQVLLTEDATISVSLPSEETDGPAPVTEPAEPDEPTAEPTEAGTALPPIDETTTEADEETGTEDANETATPPLPEPEETPGEVTPEEESPAEESPDEGTPAAEESPDEGTPAGEESPEEDPNAGAPVDETPGEAPAETTTGGPI